LAVDGGVTYKIIAAGAGYLAALPGRCVEAVRRHFSRRKLESLEGARKAHTLREVSTQLPVLTEDAGRHACVALLALRDAVVSVLRAGTRRVEGRVFSPEGGNQALLENTEGCCPDKLSGEVALKRVRHSGVA